jgi:hypothetical protein
MLPIMCIVIFYKVSLHAFTFFEAIMISIATNLACTAHCCTNSGFATLARILNDQADHHNAFTC